MSLDGGVPASAPLASLRGASSLSFQGAQCTKDNFHFEELSISDYDFCHFQLLLRDFVDFVLLMLLHPTIFDSEANTIFQAFNYYHHLASHKGQADLLRWLLEEDNNCHATAD